ncbi:hypothetical protein ACDX78_22220 [Virgibacillus oceani]
MENSVAGYIDSSLENVAPILYLFSIICGILLVIIGFYLIIKSKNTHDKIKKIVGVTCISIGFLAVFSGVIQSVF